MSLHIQSILYPTDFSDAARQARASAIDLAKNYDATLHHYHAIVLGKDDPHNSDHYLEDLDFVQQSLKTAAEKRVHALRGRPGTQGVSIHSEMQRVEAEAPAIIAYAKDHDMDLIVIGTHGRRGVRRWFLGSIAEEVVRRAPCPVLTVRRAEEARPARSWRRILVPVDLSEPSLDAIRYAAALARTNNATLQILHVVEPVVLPGYYQIHEDITLTAMDRLLRGAHDELDEFLSTAPTDGVMTETDVIHGNPASRIVEYAEGAQSDVVVISTHGLTGLKRFFMGSVAEKVVRRAPCPVLTVKTYGKSLLRDEADVD